VFGLVIKFIEHFQIVTSSNYSAIANSHTQQVTKARNISSQSAVSSAVAWSHLLTADVALPLGSRTVPVLSYQLLTATAHND
jgi:hypothetical protein